MDVVCDILESEGIAAVGYTGADEACLRILQTPPGVVILDVCMPDIPGVELFWTLRNNPATNTLPVIFFTAHDELLQSRLPNYRALGAELLRKPFKVDRLITLVRRALAAQACMLPGR